MATDKSRGQSLLEFALTLPLFLWLVLGLFDLGRGVASYTVLSNCAREGARAATIPLTSDAGVASAINSQSTILGTVPSSDITITPAAQSARSSATKVTVQVRYQFQPVAPLVSNVVGSVISMQATSTVTVE